MKLADAACADGDCTNEALAVKNQVMDSWCNLQHAQSYGVRSYNELKTLTIGTDYQVHHLVERRFEFTLGESFGTPGSWPSIVVSKVEHQIITNVWRSAIGYSNSLNPLNTKSAQYYSLIELIPDIYKNYPILIDASMNFLQHLR